MQFPGTNVFLLTLLSWLSCSATTLDVVRLPIDIQNIAVTDTHVYIGAKNTLSKYTLELAESSRVTTGPRLDNPRYCIPNVDTRDLECFEGYEKASVDNTNKVLLITPGLERLGVFLACGTLNQGQCAYRSLDTLRNVTNLDPKLYENLYSSWVSANLPTASTVAVASSDEKTLFVARTLTYYAWNMDKMITAMSARSLLTDGGKLSGLSVLIDEELIRANYKYFCADKSDDSTVLCFDINYTSAHATVLRGASAVYFTTVQKSRRQNSRQTYISKLVRITAGEKNDPRKMKIYMENQLSCRHEVRPILLIQGSTGRCGMG